MAQVSLNKEQAEIVTRRSILADGSLWFRTSKFTQVVTWLAPARVLVTGIGYNDGRCAPLVTEELARAIPPGKKLVAFVNLSGQTGQASVGREWWAEWVKANRAQLECSHMFVRSRMMDMAVSVLGMIVGGGIKAYSDRATFIAAIAENVAGFRELPTYSDLPPMLA